MSTTTPIAPSSANHQRSTSRPGSRPTTPLRRSASRNSVRQVSGEAFPLNALEPQFQELSDSLVTLEANFRDFQVMHESISRFNESFAGFLYGLNVNAYCVEFPEAPEGPESFARIARKDAEEGPGPSQYSRRKSDCGDVGDMTFMTTDSFVAEPQAPPPTQPTPVRRAPAVRGGGRGRGQPPRGGGGIPRGRGSGFSYR
ncbi:DASH complex subunit Dam1-domain-containing protein [Tricharina praecox]|uniref:DASH complex subunit Dam1-domain-containing protein n=1 Tax=Tricharina praecox TaxID=43433 RepID=UPI00221F1307|nr:DASH complex subunit Dam1-domain-containing protein [Tricharina praecox]KAI5842704.1 DASH complex subunit Dam1-domain-containing protein [Tricharina praecox]